MNASNEQRLKPLFTVAARLLREASEAGTPEAFAIARRRLEGAVIMLEILDYALPHEIAPLRLLVTKLDLAARDPKLRNLLAASYVDEERLPEFLRSDQQ